MSDSTKEVWESMGGAAPLLEIYSYWPTLHDAVVRSFSISYEAKALDMVVDYHDLSGEEEDEHTESRRITFRWSGVREAKFRLYANDLYGVEFARDDNLIRTTFDDFTWGMDGQIISESLRVVRIEPAPNLDSYPAEHAIHHEMAVTLS